MQYDNPQFLQKAISRIHKYILMIEDLIKLFEESPSKFRNVYRNNKRDNKPNGFHLVVDNTIPLSIRERYGEGKFSQMFYDIKHPALSNLCKKCNSRTKFKTYQKGYDIYCSSVCAKSDGTRTTKEKYAEAAIKRKIKMQALLNDPIRGKEYRDKISKTLTAHYKNTPSLKLKRSRSMKERIKSGKWTPAQTSTYTHWKVIIDGMKFRNSFEGLYYVFMKLYKGINIEYEKVRIEYTFMDKQHVYIVDFIDAENKEIIEIKPASKRSDEKCLIKEEAANKWSKENNMKYKIFSEDTLQEMLNTMIKNEFEHPFIDEFIRVYPKWVI